MVHMIKNRIVNNWIKENVIGEEDRELYEYGVEITVEYAINLFTTVLIVVIMQEIISGIFMYASFMMLRSYSGGVHAKSFKRCYLYSSMVILITLLLIRFNIISIWIYRGVGVVSCLYLWFTEPIASENKEVNEKEKRFFIKKEKNIIIYIVIISIVAFFMGFAKIEKGLESTLIIAFISCILARLKK